MINLHAYRSIIGAFDQAFIEGTVVQSGVNRVFELFLPLIFSPARVNTTTGVRKKRCGEPIHLYLNETRAVDNRQ